MEVKPAADDKVSRTETTQVKIEALKITYEELRSGAYESMYAGIYSQVYVPEGGSLNGITLKDDLSMQDPDNNRFRLVASQASSFGIDPAPMRSAPARPGTRNSPGCASAPRLESGCPMSSRSTPPRRPTRIAST